MTPPWEQHGANLAFWTLFAVFAVGEYALRIHGGVRRGGRRVEGWSLAVILVTVGGGLVVGLRLADWNRTEIGSAQWPLFVLGLLMMAAGLVVRLWAILTLGRYFTVDVRVHDGQTVVDRGPYRWVRHPAYTGLLVFVVGLGVALTNWASLLVLALLPAVGLLVRIRSEERALLAGLGDDYRRFAATRRRLFPGIW
jgi:protein-S-isoprenylcysteine O-methyltransferase Ste14